VNNAEFIKQYYGIWEAAPDPMLAVLRVHHIDTELYDMTVCTGPLTPDGVLPANGREGAMCAAYAAHSKRERIAQTGMSASQWRRCNEEYLRSWQYHDDMQRLFQVFQSLDADSLRALLASNVRVKLPNTERPFRG